MGKIAQNLSDKIIITSDNPRTEKPQLIIENILEGIDKNNNNYKVIENRENAIREAIKIAKKGDIVIVAGKGHENYQIIGKIKYDFDDKVVAKSAIDELY